MVLVLKKKRNKDVILALLYRVLIFEFTSHLFFVFLSLYVTLLPHSPPTFHLSSTIVFSLTMSLMTLRVTYHNTSFSGLACH